MSTDSKDLICAMCEKPLSLHEDGLDVVEKLKSHASRNEDVIDAKVVSTRDLRRNGL
jgi:hypothetical protein